MHEGTRVGTVPAEAIGEAWDRHAEVGSRVTPHFSRGCIPPRPTTSMGIKNSDALNPVPYTRTSKWWRVPSVVIIPSSLILSIGDLVILTFSRLSLLSQVPLSQTQRLLANG